MAKKKAQVLIIDDDSGMRSTLSDILEDTGYKVTGYGSGKQALDWVKKKPFDVVVVDIKLPDMDGMELLEQIKLINPESAVIMMTGYASVETAIEAMKEGAYAYLIKPFNMNELKAVIKKALREIRLSLENKKLIDRLQRSNRDLERYDKSLKDRTKQLKSANKELEAFCYSVSHDLRAPLRAVDGFSKVLLKEYSGKLNGEGSRLLGIIRNNTKQMGELIDDLLSFSRLGRQAIKVSDIDVTELAKRVSGELMASVSERKLQLDIKQLPPARADGKLIREVFVNLVSNAIKFTEPKEVAIIEIGGETDTDENIYYVKDNGVGFDVEYSNKLFGVFQRLHSTDEFEGTGVGLALVQRIISRHGGRVWAEGKINQGATFYFTLPKMQPQEHKEISVASADNSANSAVARKG